MIFNNLEDSALVEVINEMYKRAKKRLHYTLHLGIGSKMVDFRNMILSYKRAIAACKMAKQFNYPQIYFDDMGVEISEASQDGPYLFQALLYGENLQKKHALGHIWSQHVDFQNLCPLPIHPQGTVSVGISAE